VVELKLPSLRIVSIGPDGVLTWPAWAGQYKLQSLSNDLSSGSWTDVATLAQTNGGDFQVTLPITGEATFFRLHRR
jgi:hypothetical protein